MLHVNSRRSWTVRSQAGRMAACDDGEREFPRCLIDHLAAVPDSALRSSLGSSRMARAWRPFGSGVLVGSKNSQRAVVLLLARRERRVDRLDLAGMHDPLAVVTERRRTGRRAL